MKTLSNIGLMILPLALAVCFQGSRGIWAPDEGFYVGIGKGMLDTGDFLIPRLNYEPWLDKPPLSPWGIAAGMKLLGQNEWGARAFHGLCFVLTTFLVMLIGCSMGGSREGILAGIIYCTTIIPFAAANVLTPDTPLTLWTTAAFFCFWKSVEPDARRVVLWKLLMCAAFGLGFVTKGPAALVPCAAMFVFLLARRRALRFFLTPLALAGLAIFCVLGLGWYAFVAREIPGALEYLWDNQVVGRTISHKYDRNPGLMAGLYVYAPVLLCGTLPWSLMWWPMLWRGKRKILTKAWWTDLRDNPASFFLATWIGVPLLVLCLASSKLPLYALPIFPAFALGTARVALRLFEKKSHLARFRPSRVGVAALCAWIVLLLCMKGASAHWPHKRDMRSLYEAIREHLPANTHEVVVVDEKIFGLEIYGPTKLERVTTKDRPYPFFILPESLDAEFAEMLTSDYSHVFLCEKDSRANRVLTALRENNIRFREIELPYGRSMFVCEPARADSHVVRIVALGDTGKGKGRSRQFSVASALHLLHREKSFHDGVFLLGDNLYISRDEVGNPEHAARIEFEEPFAPLLKNGVPFFAVLGNHDTYQGLESFELTYPPFHMNGRRYYSKELGQGLVEMFVLDSNPLPDDDPDQVAWLDDALAQSHATWKVVALHHPLYSTALEYPSNPYMMLRLEPIFRKHGVSIVLQGHNHLYERLAPIHGIHYFTAGSGGALRKGGLGPDTAKRLAGYDKGLAFLMLEFDASTCRFTAFDSIGRTLDEGEIPRR